MDHRDERKCARRVFTASPLDDMISVIVGGGCGCVGVWVCGCGWKK